MGDVVRCGPHRELVWQRNYLGESGESLLILEDLHAAFVMLATLAMLARLAMICENTLKEHDNRRHAR